MDLIPRRLAAVVATTVIIAACGGGSRATATPAPVPVATRAPGAGPVCLQGSITASGSTALQPLVEAAAGQYESSCPGASVKVQGGGSGTGLSQLLQGAVDIGNSDVDARTRFTPEEADQLVDHVVAVQGWVMVLNQKVTGITNLTSAQARDIWTGKVTNWSAVGGPDATIVLVLRPASSGTRATWRRLVLQGQQEATGQALTEDSNGAAGAAVETTDYSTTVLGYSYYVDQQAKLLAVSLDGVTASVDTIVKGEYLVQGLGHMYSKGQPSGLTSAFLDYMLADEVQAKLIPDLSYGPAPK